MCLSFFINLHDHIARASSFLARIGKTSGVQYCHTVFRLKIRFMGMTEHHHLIISGSSLAPKFLHTQRYVIIMAMGKKHLAVSKRDLPFSRQRAEKIIVSADQISRTAYMRVDKILSAFQISQMDQSIYG